MKIKELCSWQKTCVINIGTQTLATLRVIKAGGKGHYKSQEILDVLKTKREKKLRRTYFNDY